jgi:hypothetical protein
MSIRCGHCKDRHESLAQVKACSVRGSAPTIAPQPVRVGVYRLGGKLYGVRKVRGATRLYVMMIDADGHETYLGARLLGRLERAERLELDEVTSLGRKLVQCMICGTPLENPKSRELGIGPICRGYL